MAAAALYSVTRGGRHLVPQVSISAAPSPEPQPRLGAGITHAAQLGRAGEQPGNFPLRFPSKIWSGSAHVVSHSFQSAFIHPWWRLVCPSAGSDLPFAPLRLWSCHHLPNQEEEGWGILFCFPVSRRGSSFPFQPVPSHPSPCPRAWEKECGSSLEVWPVPLGWGGTAGGMG